MTHHAELWDAIRHGLPRGRWTSLADVYALVERSVALDPEDCEPQVAGSSVPKWKRNVRNVLQARKGAGDIEWNGAAGYRLPSG